MKKFIKKRNIRVLKTLDENNIDYHTIKTDDNTVSQILELI